MLSDTKKICYKVIMNVSLYPAKVLIALLSFSLLSISSGCGGGRSEGATKLTWEAPTTVSDGTPLTDLAGYKIYYGTSSGNYTEVIDAGNVTTYTVGSLPPGTYYFAVTAYNGSGNESDYSNEASKTIP
jgi:hypothetical protein